VTVLVSVVLVDLVGRMSVVTVVGTRDVVDMTFVAMLLDLFPVFFQLAFLAMCLTPALATIRLAVDKLLRDAIIRAQWRVLTVPVIPRLVVQEDGNVPRLYKLLQFKFIN